MKAVLRQYCAGLGLDWETLMGVTDDHRWVEPAWMGPAIPIQDGVRIDAWGIRTKAIEHGAGGVYHEFCGFPIAGASTAADLDRHPWPDPDLWDTGNLRERIAAIDPKRDRAIELTGGNPFELYCWLTGLEEAMVNLAINPGLVEDALDRIVSILEIRMGRCLESAGDLIDLVFLADDLAGQDHPFFSLEVWRSLLRPAHERLVRTARRIAPHARILFHRDGAVAGFLPDLVDLGIDGLDAVQTDADGMDPAALKAHWTGRLAFHGAISVQRLLPLGTPESVTAECRYLERVLGAGGGWIAAPSHAIQGGTPPENVLAMVQAILGEERWEHACDRSRDPSLPSGPHARHKPPGPIRNRRPGREQPPDPDLEGATP
jgi:uroporphyrinogen decarboxylase